MTRTATYLCSLCMAAAGLLALGNIAQAASQFTGTVNSDYSNAANWTAGVPTTTDAFLGYPGYVAPPAVYSTAAPISDSSRFVIGGGAGGSGMLTLSGSAGTLTYGSNGGDDYVGVDGGTGFLNVNAGTLILGGNASLRIGVNAQTAVGTVTVAGGTLTSDNGGGTIALGTGGGGNTGNLNINSGTVSWTGGGGTQPDQW